MLHTINEMVSIVVLWTETKKKQCLMLGEGSLKVIRER